MAEKENKPFIATTPGVVLACLASCFLWGSAFPCVKIGYELFAIDATDVPSILVFAGTRFVIAGLMVAVGMSVAQRRAFMPARRDLPYVGALAIFQTILQYILFYVGLANCAGVTSSILEASNSFLCVLLAALVFRFERLTGRKVLGCVVGFAGVVLVNVAGEGGGFNFTLAGEGMVLASTVAAATSSNLAKLFSRDHDPVLLSGWQFVLGGAVLLATGLALGGRISPADAANPLPAVALIAYLGFISAGAYSLWSLALAANPVSRVAVFGFMNPVFGVLLSAVLLGETNVVSPAIAVAALALVSVGIVIVNRTESGDSS
ncbi:MAG TPA: DMT family transporter [Candidatus Olsenella excrementavium]|uniref:DMT family transporter n=1 Tax=Candidatus Olsenella excrementavium TaxID=2838709 RepID=A0A9D1ZBL0_9ACTN|nr:DMT family transporter [Candidatus Olsenella excrementavium]